nr:immunoglobulin light chain junction region [Macaca mulatta]
CMQALDFPITF